MKDGDNDDENNEEDNFMVLDSVGSADEDSSDETAVNTTNSTSNDTETKSKTAPAKKKKLPKVVGKLDITVAFVSTLGVRSRYRIVHQRRLLI